MYETILLVLLIGIILGMLVSDWLNGNKTGKYIDVNNWCFTAEIYCEDKMTTKISGDITIYNLKKFTISNLEHYAVKEANKIGIKATAAKIIMLTKRA